MLSVSQARKGKGAHSLEGALPACPCVAQKMGSLDGRTGSAHRLLSPYQPSDPGRILGPSQSVSSSVNAWLRIQQGAWHPQRLVPLGQVPGSLALPTSAECRGVPGVAADHSGLRVKHSSVLRKVAQTSGGH